jgi:AcrR family transcriptional regulator
MTIKEKKEARERILNSAITLFSKRGYSGVGVREIAAEANVNIAMISYYYKGKIGILAAIMERFYEKYLPLFSHIHDERLDPDEAVQRIFRNLVNFIRQNFALAMVVYNELPLDIPEIADIKARRLSELIENLGGLVNRFHMDPEDKTRMGMIGPAVMGMVFTHFRIRPVLKMAFKQPLDDKYYEQLIETLSHVFLYGVHGLSKQYNTKKGV